VRMLVSSSVAFRLPDRGRAGGSRTIASPAGRTVCAPAAWSGQDQYRKISKRNTTGTATLALLQQALGAPDLPGALVTSVQDPRGTMLDGKIKAGDVIRKFNGQTILDPRDLARKAVQTPVGSDAALEICRSGVIETVHVTLGVMPEARPIVLDDDGPRTLGLELISGQQDNGGQVVQVASVDPTGTAADSGVQKRRRHRRGSADACLGARPGTAYLPGAVGIETPFRGRPRGTSEKTHLDVTRHS
jgi:hypothetical protein